MHFFTVLPGGYFGAAFANVIAFNIAYAAQGGAFNFGAVLILGGAFLGSSFDTDGALFQTELRTGGFFLGTSITSARNFHWDTGGTGGAFSGLGAFVVDGVQLLLEDDDAPPVSISVNCRPSFFAASGCVLICQATHSLSPAQCPILPHTLH